ncbi:MAG: hypothetical protein ABF990_12290 [Acetobacter sp.]|uniref:hypothetical protein n=1 Tax=Acetobacter sp. TaxID=440 RepID=UPI0039E7397D
MVRGLPAVSALAALVLLSSSVAGIPSVCRGAVAPVRVARPGVSVVRLSPPLDAAGPWHIYPFPPSQPLAAELYAPLVRNTDHGLQDVPPHIFPAEIRP